MSFIGLTDDEIASLRRISEQVAERREEILQVIDNYPGGEVPVGEFVPDGAVSNLAFWSLIGPELEYDCKRGVVWRKS